MSFGGGKKMKEEMGRLQKELESVKAAKEKSEKQHKETEALLSDSKKKADELADEKKGLEKGEVARIQQKGLITIPI